MRPWAVFLVGILDDILSGTPLGVNSLMLLFVHWTIMTQHRVFRGKSFVLIWWAFALVALGAKLLLAATAFLIGYGLMDPTVMLVQYVLTLALYPPLALVMGRAQRVFLPAT
jgi:rod shape-determining protein MreD